MYQIRRQKDNRPIAGIFTPIKTITMAERVLAQWEYNWPEEIFFIEKIEQEGWHALLFE